MEYWQAKFKIFLRPQSIWLLLHFLVWPHVWSRVCFKSTSFSQCPSFTQLSFLFCHIDNFLLFFPSFIQLHFSFLFMGFFSRCFGSGCCKYLCMRGSKSLVCPGGSISEIWPQSCQAWPAPLPPLFPKHFRKVPTHEPALFFFFGYNQASPITKHGMRQPSFS